MSGTGTLQTWTVIRIAPRGFTAPYVVGYALMSEGPRVLVRIDADPATLAYGTELTMSRTSLPAGGGRRSLGIEAKPASEVSGV
jgi:uncharacterized OB-fold protein